MHVSVTPRPWILCVLASVLLSGAAATGEVAASAEHTFADTPENRRMAEQAAAIYRDVDAGHSRFVQVNGIRLHYLEWGDAAGVPLIWSHGYSSTGYELIQVAEALADAGYHVFSITYRGHGQTQVESYDFSLYTIADDIAAFMDAAGLKRAVIGGLSLGGGVASAFYASYPERVTALVLEDGGSVWPHLYVERVAEKLKGMPANAAPPPAMPTQFASAFDGLAALVPLYFSDAPRALDAEIVAILYSFLRPTPAGAWAFHIDGDRLFGPARLGLDPAAGNELPLLHRSWRCLLPEVIYRRLGVPMLLIDPTGDDGVFFSVVPDNRRLAEQHPQWVHHVLYPDTPHVAHPNRPEWFVRDMKLLLEWVRAAGAGTRTSAPTPAPGR